MKISYKIAIVLTALAAFGVAFYFNDRSKTKEKLNQIADEGYETAHDILFPGQNLHESTLRYGPVIPTD